MELTVKIGADQAGLAQTVERMKAQFRNTNISMPVTWAGQSAAVNQYGAIMRPSTTVPSFSEQTMSAAVGRGVSYLRTMVWSELTSLAADALNILGQKYWESLYGISDETISKIRQQHESVRNSVRGLLSAREVFSQETRRRVLEHASPESRLNFLEREKKEADAEVARRKTLFDQAKEAQAKTTGVEFERQPLSNWENFRLMAMKILGGRGGRWLANQEEKILDMRTTGNTRDVPLKPWQRRELVMEAAKAETALIEAQRKQAALEDEIRKARTESKNLEKPPMPTRPADARLSFEADAMAQAGLFAGSSILFNPSFTVAQEQLQVLRSIDGKLDKGSLFSL